MARLYWLKDHPEPVNAGEKRVLDHLVQSLPDSVVLIPNLTIPYARPEQPEEYDIIAVTPDAVFAIEVKDLAASVEITEQQMFVNGNPRSNPFLKTRIKAQKLRSKLSRKLQWFDTNGWVEHLVVLARQPASLSVCDAMKTRVVLMGEATKLIQPGTSLLNSRFHDQLKDKEKEIVSCITAGASERISPIIFGDFKATSLIFETETLEAWRAKHILTEVDVVLEVHRLKQNLTQEQIPLWVASCLKIEDIAREIGPSADIDGPRHSFQLDDGSLVVVWPDRESNTLAHFLNQMRLPDSGFRADAAKKLLEGFVSAVAHLHSRGWILGEIWDHNLAVRSNGRGAIVLGDPVPQRSEDKEPDLRWLSLITDRVNELVEDDRLKQLAEGLRHTNSNVRITAIMAMAALAGAKLQRDLPDQKLLTRFTEQKILASHQFGQTLVAKDGQLNRTVVVKHESGRPELSWASREYRTLSLPFVSNNPHVASSVGGNSLGESSYVSIELINAPTLASMIDTGVLRDPEKALAVTAQLLETLNSLHPNIEAIMAMTARVSGTMDEETQIKIGALRESGIAHNHLDPSNIFIHAERGVILTDLVRAARFGEIIPLRSINYWPRNLPRTISDPRADLFAVGSLLIRMLATNPNGAMLVRGSTTELGKHLTDVAIRAVNDAPELRYQSATKFLDALLSNVVVGKMPTVDIDVLSLQKKIEAQVNANNFEGALEICPSEWTVTRERIKAKQQLLNAGGLEIWNSGVIWLRHIGKSKILAGSTSKSTPHNGGIAEVYHSIDAEGGVIEILVCSADVNGLTERWTATGNGFGYPDRLSHAVRSLRISIDEKSNFRYMELMQAQLKKSPKYVNQATKKMVNKVQLEAPLNGQDINQIFKAFGASNFGTKQSLWGESNNKRNFLAVTFPESATHVPAIAHFISRILPLYANIKEL